ncbi:DMT family transporter [Pseudovibrio sp. SPO723]|uniref:DMT family transporter n=1 Tax=Nesiotobacter zosterae TaxID=392721 RepID=UPI0029C44D20|nr:DMT family transporter [Pseudovibrio sp. SPO723]MDX5592765.1 DMT family transporter [Pseudovibrio sp. SPO723]
MFSQSQQNRLIYPLLFIMPVFMSSNIIIGRYGIEQTEPWTLAFLRWFLAFLILVPIAYRQLPPALPTIKANLKLLLFMAFLGMWICGALVYLALKNTSATNGTLIYSAAPVFIMLIEWVFRGRRMSPRELIGIALALIGVAIIVTKGSLANLISLELSWGDLVFGVCTLSWATYSVLIRQRSLQEIPVFVLFATLAGFGALLLFPFAIAEMIWVAPIPTTPEAWGSIAGVTIVASVLAFSTYQYGIKMVGASIAGLFMYLLPPYGVLMAVVFLSEKLALFHLAGFLPIMAGLVLATLPAAAFQILGRRRA